MTVLRLKATWRCRATGQLAHTDEDMPDLQLPDDSDTDDDMPDLELSVAPAA